MLFFLCITKVWLYEFKEELSFFLGPFSIDFILLEVERFDFVFDSIEFYLVEDGVNFIEIVLGLYKLESTNY